jgi:type II restriction/modification system DNA methylase subunit YeeA
MFLGMMKAGPFDIDGALARKMLSMPNPNDKSNSNVIKPRIAGQDVTDRARDIWIIDFADMPIEKAAQYEEPFEYVRKNVKPLRDINRRERMKQRWWLFGENRPGLRKAIANIKRCIVTPEVSKYRLFIWMDTSVIPDHKLHVIARDDDYFLGVLHSKLHEIWSLKMGSTLEDRPSYSSSRIFETFPFPWPPGAEPKDDPHVQAIAQAAKELVEQRDRWLNAEVLSEAEKKKRTLTNLYNARPTWLDLAHKRLDEAVFAAYRWQPDLSDEEILEKLLSLNLERAK